MQKKVCEDILLFIINVEIHSISSCRRDEIHFNSMDFFIELITHNFDLLISIYSTIVIIKITEIAISFFKKIRSIVSIA